MDSRNLYADLSRTRIISNSQFHEPQADRRESGGLGIMHAWSARPRIHCKTVRVHEPLTEFVVDFGVDCYVQKSTATNICACDADRVGPPRSCVMERLG